jgi:hypothetical protein
MDAAAPMDDVLLPHVADDLERCRDVSGSAELAGEVCQGVAIFLRKERTGGDIMDRSEKRITSVVGHDAELHFFGLLRHGILLVWNCPDDASFLSGCQSISFLNVSLFFHGRERIVIYFRRIY